MQILLKKKKKNPAEKEQLQETQCCDVSSYTEIYLLSQKLLPFFLELYIGTLAFLVLKSKSRK